VQWKRCGGRQRGGGASEGAWDVDDDAGAGRGAKVCLVESAETGGVGVTRRRFGFGGLHSLLRPVLYSSRPRR
jgi:hypothetical protein